MKWTEEGWLRMYDDDNLAKEYVEESKLPEYPVPQIPDFDDFDGDGPSWVCENPRTGIQNLSE